MPLDELDRALKVYCDEVLADVMILANRGQIGRRVQWQYRGCEFRVELSVPTGRYYPAITSPFIESYWRLRGRPFDMLPSRPVFEWRQPGFTEWERICYVGEWSRLFEDIPPDEPDNPAGCPVRPLPHPPHLTAAAEVQLPEDDDYLG